VSEAIIELREIAKNRQSFQTSQFSISDEKNSKNIHNGMTLEVKISRDLLRHTRDNTTFSGLTRKTIFCKQQR